MRGPDIGVDVSDESPPALLNASGTVRAEVVGEILVIILNRPSVRNAVDLDMALGIEAGIDRLEESAGLRVGVLAAEGPVFCAGADLTLLASGKPLPYTDRGDFGGLVSRERTKPLIAAVDGAALAGGFELALACDMVVASVAARFGIPEVRLGLFAGGGGLVRLARQLARSAAMELALTGDPISAERAHALGLVSRLVVAGAARSEAVELARRIAANPRTAVELSRRVVLASAGDGESEAWAANAAAAAALQADEHFRDGPQAFLDDRRRPDADARRGSTE